MKIFYVAFFVAFSGGLLLGATQAKAINSLKRPVERYHRFPAEAESLSGVAAKQLPRPKRAPEAAEEFDDENADIIPELVNPEEKRLEDHIRVMLDGIKDMWDSMVESIKQAFDCPDAERARNEYEPYKDIRNNEISG